MHFILIQHFLSSRGPNKLILRATFGPQAFSLAHVLYMI